jgi:hypothetical protein
MKVAKAFKRLLIQVNIWRMRRQIDSIDIQKFTGEISTDEWALGIDWRYNKIMDLKSTHESI